MVDICYHLEMFLLLLSSFICPSPGMQPSPLSVRCRLPFPAAAHGARSVLGPPGSSWFMQAMVQLDGEEINKIKKKRGAFLFLAAAAGKLGMPWHPLCKACVSRGVLLWREQEGPTEGVSSGGDWMQQSCWGWDPSCGCLGWGQAGQHPFSWTFQTSQRGRELSGWVGDSTRDR